MKSVIILLIAVIAISTNLFAAEAGMPQLDPKYWASQAFWLILTFTILYISISKFYLPKIKNNLDNRERKIKDDLDDANKFKELSDVKSKEYEEIIENTKKEIAKMYIDSKNKLSKEIQIKKDAMEKEIEDEMYKAQKEIFEVKKNSISSIKLISEEIAVNIIENLSGDKLNKSSVKAAIEEISKQNLGKYL